MTVKKYTQIQCNAVKSTTKKTNQIRYNKQKGYI